MIHGSSAHHAFPIVSKFYWLYFVISLLCILPGLLSLLLFGLKPSIDFVGGTQIEFTRKEEKEVLAQEKVQELIGKDKSIVAFSRGKDGVYALRLPPTTDEERGNISATLSAQLTGFTPTAVVSVGPVIGKELIAKTAMALGIASVLIALYLGIRFQSLQYGVSAFIATAHDILILLGVFSILGTVFGVEVDTLFVTALLTVVSFSVHDTVVVYDRIRERKKRIVREPLSEAIDHAVFETLTRSLRNSLAVIIVLLTLFLLGGETLKWFAFALLVGTISGTYSSTFVALPLLMLWEKRKG